MDIAKLNSDQLKRVERKMEKISPFEVKNELIEIAKKGERKPAKVFLNAGRGNPNWIATVPRAAFFILGKFAMQECKRVFEMKEGIAGIPDVEGISARFCSFIKSEEGHEGASLLRSYYDYMIETHQADPDALVFEWAEAIIGDQYPSPDRILNYIEPVLQDYLLQEMCDYQEVKGAFDLFATEGGTAAMCYLYDSMQKNFLVKQGDRVALMSPIFTPYIEIPDLDCFCFDVVSLNADERTKEGYHTWQYPDDEINKLKDPTIKVLFLVNPSNPPSYALSSKTIKQIVDIVKCDNPNLMIVTDDVYGTFVPNFRSLMYELPYNTACVYSFSKYFGATGWRIAVIAIHENNVFDDLIAKMPERIKNKMRDRYNSLTLQPDKVKFIDRLVADSRMVALNHTAGLSTPQQVQMSLFAIASLIDKKNIYKTAMQELIKKRLHALWDNTGFTLVEDSLRAGYYSEIDIMVWAEKFYGDKFSKFLEKNYEPIDFVFRLAIDTSIVLLNGSGFDGPPWSIRVSLANLDENDYKKIGKAVRKILDQYADIWRKESKL